MAEISCPECGELNPQGISECQSCHADLSIPESSSTESEEQSSASGREIPAENPPDLEPSLQDETEVDPAVTDEAPPEEEDETPEWLRRIRIRHASDQLPGEPALENLDSSGWDAGDESREETSIQEQVDPSGEFLDWDDPQRQASDTLPIVPTEPPSSEAVETREQITGRDDANLPEQFLQGLPPSAFSYNLRITSTQHAHADLLDSIVSSEGVATPLSQRKQAIPSPLLRWIIGIVLFAAVLWPDLLGGQEAPLPAVFEETGQVNNLVEQLPEEASVLLAFDYDPGFSGELDASAAAVVDHLLSRGAYLTLVSTIPTGPMLAERFLSETFPLNHLVRNTHFVNLGFIPGGPTGLLSLAEDLQRTLPYTLEGEAAWIRPGGQGGRSELPPLEGIEQLSDFNLVMILVDDPSTARSWIEQVQPSLTGGSLQTPMAMVVSAQAEPLIRAYYDANPRQVQGFVAGLRGGTAYEQMTGRELMPASSWESFVFGMSAAGLLLLIGGLVGIASTLFDQRGHEGDGGRT